VGPRSGRPALSVVTTLTELQQLIGMNSNKSSTRVLALISSTSRVLL